MIEIIKHPASYCLVGNPVLFELRSDSADAIPISIKHENQEIVLQAYPYKQNGMYYAQSDIAEILKSFFENGLPIYGETIAIAEYHEFVRKCTIKIAKDTYTINAIDGGISNDAILELNETNDDVFSYRLINAERSLLFTTRTNSPNLTLRESELFPFVFIHPGKAITFISSSGNVLAEKAFPKGTPCLMDLAFVRQTFEDIYEEQPTNITIQIDGADSLTVNIKKSEYSEHMLWLCFKNSLGGYECIEITGKGTYTPELEEIDSYQQYNQSGIFTQYRPRQARQDIITIQTGYKNKEELNFLLDMLATDKAYLVYPDKRIEEVIPSADHIKYDLRITAPTSLEFKLKKTTSNKYHSPQIDLIRPGAWIWDGIWDDYARWFDGKQIKDNIE